MSQIFIYTPGSFWAFPGAPPANAASTPTRSLSHHQVCFLSRPLITGWVCFLLTACLQLSRAGGCVHPIHHSPLPTKRPSIQQALNKCVAFSKQPMVTEWVVHVNLRASLSPCVLRVSCVCVFLWALSCGVCRFPWCQFLSPWPISRYQRDVTDLGAGKRCTAAPHCPVSPPNRFSSRK